MTYGNTIAFPKGDAESISLAAVASILRADLKKTIEKMSVPLNNSVSLRIGCMDGNLFVSWESPHEFGGAGTIEQVLMATEMLS